jgi:hypothetical protein
VSGQLAWGTNQSLEYRSGGTVVIRGGSGVSFKNGYVVSGFLPSGYNQSLEYRPGKSAQFTAFVAFRSGAYVKSAFVAGVTALETAQGMQTVQALSYVTFDDNDGYLASVNPPTGSACYKCEPQFDPSCSNPGGLPPCK